ncbi:ubiquitin-associated 2-like protein [Sarcoptes scabiei]|uniref:Ubiquitin-associated 2-like protein n=1 Tax=Sarcoptes scabiei TaxID=52283 RepID=A0A132ABD2_SARSC|nr:ubiquitin-associated 2-like protein [Sarcoptes scabiei]
MPINQQQNNAEKNTNSSSNRNSSRVDSEHHVKVNDDVGKSDDFIKNDKYKATAEQMRIASLMSDKKDDDLKPKIEKIVELTGASREDAAVALYDCDNDMPKAIEMILDGESFDSEWQSTGRKKKTKAFTSQKSEALTNGGTKPLEKTSKSTAGKNINQNRSKDSTQRNNNFNNTTNATAKNKKKEFKPYDSKHDGIPGKNENNEADVFASSANENQKKGGGLAGNKRGGGSSRGRGLRGKGIARGSRTFMNRGMQNNDNNDGFPNSIETWSNNAIDSVKTNDDLNTMTVGNWSDVAANEDWSEEDWTTAPMETKVFTPSTKVIAEKNELKESPMKTLNQNSNESQVYVSATAHANNKTNEEKSNQSQAINSMISNINKRNVPTPTPGQALLQQIQQSNSQQQPNSNIQQYTLSQYSKQATESIKSLVGMTSTAMLSQEHPIDNSSKAQQPNNQNRIKVQNSPAKITDSAVEMPSSDSISNLTLHFGSLDFGSNNFAMNSNDSSLFDQVGRSTVVKKPENKSMPLLSTNPQASDQTNYRGSQANQQPGKSILPGQVLQHSLNNSILNNDHRNDKALNSNSYSAPKPSVERKNDYISSMSYKSSSSMYPTVGVENVYSVYQQQQQQQPSNMATNLGYYSTNTNLPFGNANLNVNQALIANSAAYNASYNNSVSTSNNTVNSNQKVIRDIDGNLNSNSVSSQQINNNTNVSNKAYEQSSIPNIPGGNNGTGVSLSLMSNSTSTTNAIKNTLSSSKGMHNVHPAAGVNNSVQPAQVLTSPYLMGNAGLPIHYYPYDLQYSTAARDHSYSPYATADVKYNRNSESDILPVSSQTASAVQTATQAHNPYVNYPPGYGYFLLGQSIYGTTQPALYPVAQATQNTAAANSTAFAKPNANAYGSHSFNTGYDLMGTASAAAVPQTQDYVNKSYQQHKQITGNAANDLTNNPSNIYSKTHPQLKNYDNKGFQTQTPQMNLTNSAQSAAAAAAANLSSAYNNAYMLPHQQTLHPFANAEPNQQVSAAANQRNLSQGHKNINSNTGVAYAKINWN